MSDYADDLRELSLTEIAHERQEYGLAAERVKTYLANIQTEIDRRFSGAAKLTLDEQGKSYGTASREIEGGFKLKADIKQTVKWDGAALKAIAAGMGTLQEIEHWFKIEFSVPEAKFKAIPPGDLLDDVTAARTTKLSPLKVTLIDPARAG